jgi:diacylglycerol kinase family enzyme
VAHLVKALRRQGLRSKIAWTPEDRAGLVAEAATDRRCRCLVAAGGDGTVAALINERPAVPLTVLSAGTENLFARHFGLRGGPRLVAEAIAAGRVARIDLGRADGRRFSLMAGIGFDAEVVTRHHEARVGLAGVARPTHRAAYVEPILRASLSYRFPPLTVTVADPGREEVLVGTTAFVFNLPSYALGLPLAPTAVADDGLLDLVVFRDAGPFRALHYLWLALRGLHLSRPDVHHRRVAHVLVSTTVPVPFQLDGDPGGVVDPGAGQAPWSIDVLPAAVDIVVPPSYG